MSEGTSEGTAVWETTMQGSMSSDGPMPAMPWRLRRSGRLLGLLWLLGAFTLASATTAVAVQGEEQADAPDARLGWHGEVMPEGMTRSEVEGEYLWQKDGAVMVYVPPGSFPMGSEKGAADERPVHPVWLDGFYIDKHEVSWGRWKQSGLPYSERQNTRLPQPEAPDWGIQDDQPVLNTSWRDAQAYAAWAGKRLPTEAEWEKAARGTDSREFPWGDEPPTFDRAVWREHPIALESTAPVTCCEAGASPYGALNMAGNVYEWVQDAYDPRFYAESPARNPVNRPDEDVTIPKRVLRGGAFVLEEEDLRSAYRYTLLEIDRTPYIGFRTVVSGESSVGGEGAGGEDHDDDNETEETES